MPTRNVVLSDHQSELVEELISSGRYQNASEVLQEGLRLVEQRGLADAASSRSCGQPLGPSLARASSPGTCD